MTKTTTCFFLAWLFLLFLLSGTHTFAQTQPSLTESDKKNITAKAGQMLTKLNKFLNDLIVEDLEKPDADNMIKTGYETNSEQVFYNGQVRVEDDISPEHTSASRTDDSDVDKYLHDLYLYYSKRKPGDPSTIIFSNPRFLPVQQGNNSIYIKGYFTSSFKGKHSSNKLYQPSERVVEMRAEKPGKWWVVYITRLAFVQPGEGMEQVSQSKNNGRPTIPANLTINSDEIPYRQPDDNQLVTLKFNAAWLEVVKSEATDVPLGFYQRRAAQYVYDEKFTIHFEQNNNRFIFRKGLEYRAFERVNPITNKRPKTDTTAKPSLPLAVRKPVVQTDSVTRIAVQQPKVDSKPNPPASVPSAVIKTDSGKTISFNQDKLASKSKVKLSTDRILKQRTDTANTGDLPQGSPVLPPKTTDKIRPATEPRQTEQMGTPAVGLAKSTARSDTSQRVALKLPGQPKPEEKQATSIIMPDYKIVAKPRANSTGTLAEKLPTEPTSNAKKEKPIVAVPESKTLGPTLTKALDAEAKKMKARYRTQGWLQIVAGVAGLAGSYVGYSATKKDYDVYTANVEKLNVEYNNWLAVARQPSGEPLTPLSITSYGKPGIYGAYAGGAISLGAVLNGIRLLGKAGKIRSATVKK